MLAIFRKFNIKSLFFDNRTINQTIFKNTFWLGAGTMVSRLLGLVLLIYVARILGAAEYGKFAFALSFVSLFVVFLNMGLSQIIVREFSNDEKRKEFYSVISLKILLSFGALVLLVIGSFFITQNIVIRILIWLLGGYIIFSGFSSFFYDFFQARQKMEYQAFGIVLESLLLLVFGFVVIFIFPSVMNLGWAYFFSSLVALIIILIFFTFKIFPLRIYWEKIVWKKFILISWPLALTALFSTLYNYIDSVMLGYLNQIIETGWYNAAYRIANLTLLPMGFVVSSFYPALSGFYKESREKIQKVWDNQMKIIVILVVPIAIGGIVLAPNIIKFIYGSDFNPSILAFQILIIMAVVIFFHYPLNHILVIFNQQKKIFWIALIGAIVNIILNLILIPSFSLYGAAISSVITNVIIFIFYYILISKQKSLKVFNLDFLLTSILALISGALMYLAIIQPFIYNLNIFISVFIGAVSYIIIFLILVKILKILKIWNLNLI